MIAGAIHCYKKGHAVLTGIIRLCGRVRSDGLPRIAGSRSGTGRARQRG